MRSLLKVITYVLDLDASHQAVQKELRIIKSVTTDRDPRVSTVLRRWRDKHNCYFKHVL